MKNIQHPDPARAIGGTGLAQETAAQPLINAGRITQQFPRQAVEQNQLASRHIGFATGFSV